MGACLLRRLPQPARQIRERADQRAPQLGVCREEPRRRLDPIPRATPLPSGFPGARCAWPATRCATTIGILQPAPQVRRRLPDDLARPPRGREAGYGLAGALLPRHELRPRAGVRLALRARAELRLQLGFRLEPVLLLAARLETALFGPVIRRFGDLPAQLVGLRVRRYRRQLACVRFRHE